MQIYHTTDHIDDTIRSRKCISIGVLLGGRGDGPPTL